MPMHNPEQGIQETKPTAPVSTAIQSEAPSAAPVPVAASPAAAALPAPASTAALARIDDFCAVLLLVLAFFVACFAVSNADFWMHLATGRLIAQGEYQFGVDPFSYASE